jgi:hypothetical protein
VCRNARGCADTTSRRRNTLTPFAIYCTTIGIVLTIVFALT